MSQVSTLARGRDIQSLLNEVGRQRQTRQDYVARSTALRMDDTARLGVNSHGIYSVNETGHGQIAEYVGIPRDYYRRMQAEAPELLAANVNGWMQRRPVTERRLVRTLDSNVRAVLSDRYRPLDNFELMEQTLPVLFNRPELSFHSADVTETRLYIKIVSSQLQGEVKAGDVIRMGLIISNSEVGMGALVVAPFTDRLLCSNGAVHTNLGKRRAHLGKTLGDGDEEAQRYFTDETRAADDRAFFLKVRDTISGVLSGDVLAGLLEDMRGAAGEKIEGDPVEAVELAGRSVGLTEDERSNVLRKLIEGADLSRWGLANAITDAAKDAPNFDRLTDLQTIGGRLMSQPLADVVKVTAKRRTRPVAVA